MDAAQIVKEGKAIMETTNTAKTNTAENTKEEATVETVKVRGELGKGPDGKDEKYNVYSLSAAQKKVFASLRAVGPVTVRNVKLAGTVDKEIGPDGKPKKTTVEKIIEELTFDFSTIDPETFFATMFSRAIVVQYRAKFWVPAVKDATDLGATDVDVSDFPALVTMKELCSAGERKARTALKTKVSTMERDALIMASGMAHLIHTMRKATQDKGKADIVAQACIGSVTWDGLMRFMAEHSNPEWQETAKAFVVAPVSDGPKATDKAGPTPVPNGGRRVQAS